MRHLFLALLFFGVQGQQVGILQPESHPSLTWESCTAGTGCISQNGKLTMDANFRWLHAINGTQNCFTQNTWNATLCSSPTECTKNCALEGIDYKTSPVIRTSKDELSLIYTRNNGGGPQYGSKVYLLANDNQYQTFNLLNKEFSFTVNTGGLPCGVDGALYFVSMDTDGGASRYPANKAGAAYGTGYCDAGCSRYNTFVNGRANVYNWQASSSSYGIGHGDYGSCCPQVDLWEANAVSTSLNIKSCNTPTQIGCTADACEQPIIERHEGSPCDLVGCDFNPYRMGNTTFYGVGQTVNTNQPFTVVTQFLTDDGTSNGNLSEVKRFYVQNGVKIPNPASAVTGVTGNSLTSDFCTNRMYAFGDLATWRLHGNMAGVSRALAKGMVLAASLSNGGDNGLLWLDGKYPDTGNVSDAGVVRGICPKYTATPESLSPPPKVVFSKIRVGSIGSTT